jgi:hypothetical protein
VVVVHYAPVTRMPAIRNATAESRTLALWRRGGFARAAATLILPGNEYQ